MAGLADDVRYGIRRLRRSPGFATTALLTLALGIGATTAIFTLIYQVILRSMPVKHSEQLYKVGKQIECCVDSGLQDDWRIFSYDLYRTLKDNVPGAQDMAAVQAGVLTVSERRENETASQPLDLRVVSGNYFEVLGVKPEMGRLLRPEDDREGATPVVVLSYPIWQTKFHGDPSLIGQTVLLTGRAVTIVGITAQGFLGDRNATDPAGVWLPLAQEPLFSTRALYKLQNSHWLDLLVRIPDASKVPAIQNAIRGTLVQWLLANRDPKSNETVEEVRKQTTELASASGGINDLRDEYQKSLTMLQMIAGFVLLIACANLANLMLVRGVARRQELSVRSALGASRNRLIREMLVESVLLAIAGGVLGLVVANLGVKAMLALAMGGAEVLPVSATPSLPVLGFAFALSTVTGVLFGIAPAMIASRTNPAEALRGANRATGHSGGMQKTLVVLQAALSVALLSTAALLIQSLNKLEHQNFRFETKGRVLAFIDLQAAGYKYEQLDGLYKRIDQAFVSGTGLHDVSYATYTPMSFNAWGTNVAVQGEKQTKTTTVRYLSVSSQFFDAVGTRLLLGRKLNDHDTATSTHVAVVNEQFVKKILDGKQPMGTRFGLDKRMAGEFQIVGVVEDSKYGDPGESVPPMFFTPMTQTVDFSQADAPAPIVRQAINNEQFRHYASNMVARYDGDPAVATATLRRVLNQVDSQIPIIRLGTYDDQVSKYFTQTQMVVRLTTIFGGLALLLASIGLYGVTAYGVERRIPEIGVRMALGADRVSVVQLILRGAAIQTALGVGLGIPLALLAGRLLQSQLYEVSGVNVPTLLAACGVMVLSALVASAVPAGKAANVEPMRALRME